ncbi:MAG: ABC transporter permease, partial [Hyphomicrobiales bacterium]
MPIVLLVVRRTLLSIVTLLLVSLIIFSMLEVLPGDVATRILGRDATPESLEVLRTELGLDRPAAVRYLDWLGGLATGDLGKSLVSSRPISEILAPRIFNTLLLSLYAFALYLPLTVIPAVLQALTRDRGPDYALSVVTLVLLSMPDFLLATILLLTFVLWIPVLPAISLVDASSSWFEYLKAMTLPALT